MTVNPGSPDYHREDRIRALAYRIWEEEGQPEGMDEDHWRRAAEMIDAEVIAKMPAPDPDWLKRSEDPAALDNVPPTEASDEVIASVPSASQRRGKRA
jgi:hypothetical protein